MTANREDSKGNPIEGLGFHTFPYDPARRPYKFKILIENNQGVTVRPCPDWKTACQWVDAHQDCYAVLRYREPNNGQWYAYKAYYPKYWPFEHETLTDPLLTNKQQSRNTPPLLAPAHDCVALLTNRKQSPKTVGHPKSNNVYALKIAAHENLLAKNKARLELLEMNRRRFEVIEAFKPVFHKEFEQMDLFD